MNNLQSPALLSLEEYALVSVKDLAKLLGYKPQTIRKWLSQDKLPEGLVRPRKIRKRNYWLKSDIISFISTLHCVN